MRVQESYVHLFDANVLPQVAGVLEGHTAVRVLVFEFLRFGEQEGGQDYQGDDGQKASKNAPHHTSMTRRMRRRYLIVESEPERFR